MSLDTFTDVLTPLRDHLLVARLDGLGEPLLSPHICDMVSACHDAHIATVVSTNMSRLPKDDPKSLLDAGLDHLIVAIDGTTQDVYAKYRVGGNLDEVMGNLKALLYVRNKSKRRKPMVEWQFLVFDHNRHQMAEAYAMADDLGIDRFTPIFFAARDHGAPPRKAGSRKKCVWLWHVFTVGWRGNMSPCCLTLASNFALGNVSEESPCALWNADPIRSLRSGQVAGTPCADCSDYPAS